MGIITEHSFTKEDLNNSDPKQIYQEYLAELRSKGDPDETIVSMMTPDQVYNSIMNGLELKERNEKATEHQKEKELESIHDALYAVDLLSGQYLTDKEKKNVLIEHGFTDSQADDIIRNYNTCEAVVRGEYGNGDVRKSKLEEAGFDPLMIQNMVNRYKGIDVDRIYTRYGGVLKYNNLLENMGSLNLKAYSALLGNYDYSKGKTSEKDITYLINQVLNTDPNKISDVIEESDVATKTYEYFAQTNSDETFIHFANRNQFEPDQLQQADRIRIFLNSLNESDRSKLLANFK